MTFYICDQCGGIITPVSGAEAPAVCCGEGMRQLIPGEIQADPKKHIPVVEDRGRMIQVRMGEIEHPMLPEHYIMWIALETNQGSQIRYLSPGERPQAQFTLRDAERVRSVYAYCNIHGLWKN